MKHKKMTLHEWIDHLGPKEVARLLRVNESSVRHWSRGYVLPRPEQMKRIMELSKGAVTPTDLVENHFKKSNSSRFGEK